jgi:DNA-binding NarL/FixJ family response regulator
MEEQRVETGAVDLRSLTVRELEVLEAVASGMTNAEVARRLGVTIHAIKFHLAVIYRRLGVANRTEAAVAYFRHADDLADSPAA